MVDALAFDLGASSGRAVVGQFADDQLRIVDVYRFHNEPVRVHEHLYWDILRLFHEMKQAMIHARLQGHAAIQSIGVDTWGVDFGLLNTQGELLANPYHYRDDYTLGCLEEVLQQVPRAEIFHYTGIQFLPFNTIYQLYALKKMSSPLLAQAEALLLIPELLRYFLTGERISEWTIASTTQLCNPYTRSWDTSLIETLGLPAHLFGRLVEPGTQAGSLLPAICAEVGLPSLPIIAVAEHDTASAVAAVPAAAADFAYLSCGTWSLLGTEMTAPLINEQALSFNVTNEGGVNGTSRLLKNVTGLWLLQECRRIWRNEGMHFSYADEHAWLMQARPFQAFINPDDPMFMSPSHMPHQIQQYCLETGQYVPQAPGELLRCIIESLALRYRSVLEQIELLTHKRFTGLHMVGGGAQNVVLCQYTANALNRPVWAGPYEATAVGNLLIQYIALGQLENLQHARNVVRNSFPIQTYEPADTLQWKEAFATFCRVTLL